MLKIIQITGSKQTSFHTFDVTVTDTQVTVSSGSFWQRGVEVLRVDTPTTFTIPDVSQNVFDQGIYATKAGIIEGSGAIPDLIDRIAWFGIDVATPTTVDVYALKIVEPS